MPSAAIDDKQNTRRGKTLPPSRRQRISGEARRAHLIQATIEVIAEDGLGGATLRRVADRAGVSNGLIRHYFLGKHQMILDAYAETIRRLTGPARAALARKDLAPDRRLRAFLCASLDPSVTENEVFSVWAAFVSLVHVDPDFESVHRAGYLDYQAEVEPLLREVLRQAGRDASAQKVATLAMQINALLDGLWIEGSLLSEHFTPEQLTRLALDGAGRLLGLQLKE